MRWFGLAAKAYDAFQLHKARRKAKMVNKAISFALRKVGLQRFSKAIAVPIGGLVGILVTKAPFLAPLITEEWVMTVSLAIATAVVGAFPANEDKPQK